MHTVFLSYVDEDGAPAGLLAEALKHHGISVWGGRGHTHGQPFASPKEALERADCVVALWSKASARSGWVRQEARLASKRGVLLSVLLGHVSPPVEVETFRPADLVDWEGEAFDAEFLRLLRSIEAIAAEAPGAPAAEKEELVLGGEAPGDVQFTAYHPKEVTPRAWYTVLAYAHLPDALADVQADSRVRLGPDAAGYGRGKGEATTVIKRGAEIVVVPELAGCRFNPPRVTFAWLKDWHRAEFELRASPEEAGYVADGAVNGRIAFYVGPVLVGETKIWAHISETAGECERAAPAGFATGEAYRRIFVSYAHKDAKIVDALERAYTALGDTYLRDVRTLRAGESWNPALLRMIEQSDIFQLCWSEAAKHSCYVDQEWRHALKQQRPGSFIRPHYWEKPMPEPPAELAALHFAYLPLD